MLHFDDKLDQCLMTLSTQPSSILEVTENTSLKSGLRWIELYATRWPKVSARHRVNDLLSEDGMHFQRQVKRACQSRSFFVTKEGFMGLAPAYTQLGDIVVVLIGDLRCIFCDQVIKSTFLLANVMSRASWTVKPYTISDSSWRQKDASLH